MTTYQPISAPPPGAQRDITAFESGHEGSLQLWNDATRLLAGGVSHTNRRTFPHPIFYTRARGARKWDVDGNEYVDYNLGSASLLLGHAHPSVIEAVQERVALGTPPMCHPQELEWAALVQELIPSAELIRFVASGSEATKLGMRVARAVTGRTGVVRLEGHFHGWHDYVMRGYREPFSSSVSSGVPDPVADTVRSARLSDPVAGVAEQLESEDVALVILEPSGATWGTVPLSFEELVGLRALCSRHGTLLMFDEVITGFRFSPGGVQAAAGVIPDLTSLGKTLTGGLPGGALVGRADIMDAFRPGRDEPDPYVFHFGTFNGHPLTASAGAATLTNIKTGEPHRIADAYAADLRAGVQQAINELEIQGLAYGDASMFHVYLESPGDDQQQGPVSTATVDPYKLLAMPPTLCDALQFQLRIRGVDLVAFNGGFTSSAHGDPELDQTLEAFRGALRALRDDGALSTV